MTTLGPGTYRQQFVRAHTPDGRSFDSEPTGFIRSLSRLAEAFPRWTAPKGTRFEAMERTVTITATRWEPAGEGS
jgi:hypothetical protein